MPLFEYVCESCGHRTEVLQRIADPPLETCPECGGPVKKVLSAPAFQFKGSGWYVTDYAKKGGAETPSTGGESSGEGATKKESATGSESGSGSASSPGEGASKASAPAKPSSGSSGAD